MSVEVKTPVLPESVADAAIATWHKQPGEHVTEGENLVDLETDKIVLEVPAPVSGALEEVLQEEGAVVVAGDVLAKIAPGQTPTLEISKDDVEKAIADKEASTASAPASNNSDLPPHASPAVRQELNAKGLSESDVKPSGPKSRILKEDVATVATSVMVPGEREEKRVPMTRLRARVAERLQQAQSTAAILTTFNEVDMQPVMDLRAKYKDEFIKKHDVKLGFMSFFVKAACEALKKYPAVNASIDGNDIVYHGFYDVGVAVSTERGLVVPVLRSADQLSLAGIEENIIDFGQRAQAGKLGMDDLSGGTFTISNGGVFGSLMSTPIINPPQTGILGMHTIQKRPIAMGDQVVIRPMMYLALSYDHRLIDGKEAVQFLVTIKQLIEDPTRLLLDL